MTEKILKTIIVLLSLFCLGLSCYRLGQMDDKETKAHIIVFYTSLDQSYTKFDKPVEWYGDNYCE